MTNWVADRHLLAVNGVAVPLRATERAGEHLAGIRFKAWNPPSSLHPTTRPQTPLVLDVHFLRAIRRGDVPDQVRRVLRMASTMAPMRPMGSTALHEVAAALSVHARTLGRRLNAAGTSFQALVDEDRFEQSRQLLENSTVAVNEIAASLDYADASAFIRAFRRWTGMSPREFRKREPRAPWPSLFGRG